MSSTHEMKWRACDGSHACAIGSFWLGRHDTSRAVTQPLGGCTPLPRGRLGSEKRSMQATA
eukprot:6212698-Prymnesium_polylepis.1